MEIQHRYFVQYMLKKGVIPVNKALKYCQNIPQGNLRSMDQLKFAIITINREISKQNFKIAFIICEVTNQELFIWANTKNDNISKLQITFSAIELEYFHVILQEIINSEENRLTFVVVLNITSTLTAPFTRDNGQKALKRWFNGGYFIKKEDFVYLGPRLILEFTSYLKTHRPDQICKLCSELVFIGKSCGMCSRLLHSYCFEKYLKTQDKCPACRKHWTEKTSLLPIAQELQIIHDQSRENSMDSDMDDDELIPGTSSDVTEETTLRRSSRKRNS